MRTFLPFVHPTREMESRLGEFRVDRGLTIKDLCLMAKVHQGTYSALNNGMLSPICVSGVVRKSAKRLSDFLGVSLSDLFPRYFCDFYRNDNPFVEEQMYELGGCGSTPKDPLDILEERERTKSLFLDISENTPEREVKVFMMRMDGYTLAEIGEKFNVSRERARQMEKKCINKARARYHKRQARRLSNEHLV